MGNVADLALKEGRAYVDEFVFSCLHGIKFNGNSIITSRRTLSPVSAQDRFHYAKSSIPRMDRWVANKILAPNSLHFLEWNEACEMITLPFKPYDLPLRTSDEISMGEHNGPAWSVRSGRRHTRFCEADACETIFGKQEIIRSAACRDGSRPMTGQSTRLANAQSFNRDALL
ncbi:MAG: hypothetical protein AAFQ84_13065 [Pseudomonadota bacterium]